MPALRACLFSIAFVGSALIAAWAAHGQKAPPPARGSESGPHPSTIRVLTPTDHDLFVRAFDAAAHGDWTGARTLAAASNNPVARKLLEWRYALDPDSGASFAEIEAVANTTQGWPLPRTLQARAEAAMAPDLPSAQVIAWFAGRTPSSGIGRVRLGEALVATGETERGARLIRQAWEQTSFDPPTELAITQKDGAWLTPDSDRVRLDMLLWRDEATAARRQMARVDKRSAAVAAARIALDGGLRRARSALAKVRGSDDPGLLFDWSRAYRLEHHDDEAHAMLLRISAPKLVRDHPASWWNESAIQARDALAAGDPHIAFRLIVHAGFSSGNEYAEQQFLGGFIALRFLKQPRTALTWFRRLDGAVARPISKARAYYWQGRAYEALGDTAKAAGQYRLAAAFPETFYGQVALARVEPEPLLHIPEAPVEAAAPVELDGDILMPQIKILADLGRESSLRLFIDRDLETNTSPGHVERLMLSLREWGYPEVAVRLAKTQSYGGTIFSDLLFPVMALPAYHGPGTAPDPALILSLIRQETEFDPVAVSAAGAQGLIQVMPENVRALARTAGLPYRPRDLLSDPAYDIQLGMVEIMNHFDQFGGSLALAIASYNAGATNARKWIEVNGDPRAPGADPIDWIERIPFGETRNYVERVLENLQVYRNRLAGRDTPLRIMNDLYGPGGAPPPVLRAAAR